MLTSTSGFFVGIVQSIIFSAFTSMHEFFGRFLVLFKNFTSSIILLCYSTVLLLLLLLLLYMLGQPKLPAKAPTGQQTFSILSVKNVKLGEEVNVSMAISQGILDASMQRYRNNITGEVLSLDQAVKKSMFILYFTRPACMCTYVCIFTYDLHVCVRVCAYLHMTYMYVYVCIYI